MRESDAVYEEKRGDYMYLGGLMGKVTDMQMTFPGNTTMLL
jgi:hypothetical protein